MIYYNMKTKSLAKTLLNNPGLIALTVAEEQLEIAATMARKAPSKSNKPVILKRTFNMTLDGTTLRFWRVMSPDHRNYQSDLSIEGLKEWGIL